MDDYKELARILIEDHIKDSINYDDKTTREQILNDLLEDTQNVFGNIDGSRTYSTYEAEQFINKSGAIWDDDILELFEGMGNDYFGETISRGAETLDVVILELLAPQIINEMLEEGK